MKQDNLEKNVIDDNEKTHVDDEKSTVDGEVVAKQKENWVKKIFLGLAYSIIPFLIFLVVQQLSWTGNMILGKPGAHPEIWLDDKIPLVSQFVWIYFLTFPLAIFTYFLVAYKDKKHLWNLWLTLMISFAISGIIYFFWQTEMVKPELDPVTLSDKFLLWTWGSCDPICCLPSQHCFMAFGMMIGVYNQRKKINPWLRWSLIICGVLIVFATVFLKQHYVLDVVASFVIMIPTYLIVKYAKFGDHMVKKYGDWVWFGKKTKAAPADVEVATVEEVSSNTTAADENVEETIEVIDEKTESIQTDNVEDESANNTKTNDDELKEEK